MSGNNRGPAVAMAAIAALHDPAYTDVPGFCEKFVREVVQSVTRSYDCYFVASALLSMERWHGSAFDVWHYGQDISADVMAGDLLYKGEITSGASGHVGIAFHNQIAGESVICVAENSHFQSNALPGSHPVQGAKGWRTLQHFGAYEMRVRLT